MGIAACQQRGAGDAFVPAGDVTAELPKATFDDKPFDPATLKGKPSLVMFASPTCGHCMKELPVAWSVAQGKSANAVVVFVSGAKPDGGKVADKVGFKGTVLHDTDGALRKKYNITGVPYTVVLKPDGTAATAFRGEAGESKLAGAIASAGG